MASSSFSANRQVNLALSGVGAIVAFWVAIGGFIAFGTPAFGQGNNSQAPAPTAQASANNGQAATATSAPQLAATRTQTVPDPTRTQASNQVATATAASADTVVAAPTVSDSKPAATQVSAANRPQGQIAYTCYDGIDDEICIIKPDGSGLRQLTSNDVEDYYPSFSNDGNWIAFARQMTPGQSSRFELFRINLKTDQVSPLTKNGSKNASPAYSWDDTQIAYTSKLNSRHHHIWIMDADGRNPVQLTSDGNNFDPAWSFSGEWISFTSDRNGSRQLWIMRYDGSEQRQITDFPQFGGRNDWSFDDRFIFFYAGEKGVDRQIYRVELATGTVSALTQDGLSAGPGTSRYGGWIAWQSAAKIWISREDGSGAYFLPKSSEFDYQPRWGP